MDFSTEEIQVYTVGFDVEKMSPFANIEKLPSAAGPEQTKKIYEVLNCNGIEIVDYSDDIAIVVNDRGMLTEGQPIFEIITFDNTVLLLAGKLLFVKNIYTTESVDFGELSPLEIQHLIHNLKIRVKGLSKI